MADKPKRMEKAIDILAVEMKKNPYPEVEDAVRNVVRELRRLLERNEQLYVQKHNESGFKEGDRVKVTRKCGNYENGWANTWVKGMKCMIDVEATITMDGQEGGFEICPDNRKEGDAIYQFPYFILEKVK